MYERYFSEKNIVKPISGNFDFWLEFKCELTNSNMSEKKEVKFPKFHFLLSTLCSNMQQ